MINKKSSSKTVSAPPKSKPKKPKPKKKYSLTTICFAITAILIIISTLLFVTYFRTNKHSVGLFGRIKNKRQRPLY
jgi:hypothetical protein